MTNLLLRNNEMNNLNKKLTYDKLMYYFKNENRIPINLNYFDHPLGFIKNKKRWFQKKKNQVKSKNSGKI